VYGGAVLAQQPTANAGPDLYLTSGQTTTLQGSGYDPSGYSVNYYWSCSGGTLSGYNVAQPAYTAPYINYGSQATYTCTLTVTNNYGGSSTDSATIYLNYNGSGSGSNSVQTTYATYISNFQATLNGSLSGSNYSSVNYAYFQWGLTNNYGSETPRQVLSSSGYFMQNIADLNPGTTYHFRAVVQVASGAILLGQDMTLVTSGGNNYNSYGYGNNTTGALNITKQVIDITSGNLNWQTSVSASPSDVVSFAITLQAGGQDVHNVIVRDVLPANLAYKGNLLVNTSPNGGDITSGVNIGTIYAGQSTIVSYQAQVANAENFGFGQSTLTDNTTVTSSEAGTQTATATVSVSKALVYGASSVSTGLTNNFLTDSFFLPLLIIVFCLWFYFSGSADYFADRMKAKFKK